MKIRIEKISNDDAFLYAEIKMRIWKICYDQILPKTYLDNLSITQKARIYQEELKNDPLVSFYFIMVSDIPADILKLRYHQNPAQDSYVCIEDLYFLQKYQCKGYGGYVLNFVMKKAKEHHCHFITAWIVEHNQAAEGIVSKLDFTRTSRIQIHDKTGVISHEYRYDLYDRPELLIR